MPSTTATTLKTLTITYNSPTGTLSIYYFATSHSKTPATAHRQNKTRLLRRAHSPFPRTSCQLKNPCPPPPDPFRQRQSRTPLPYHPPNHLNPSLPPPALTAA